MPKAADVNLVETTVINAYANVLGFGWKARRVFIDTNSDQRKWISLRAFMRQHWETFELEFATIKEDLQHHLDVLLHSVQPLHFDSSRKAEQARQREEESRIVYSDILCACPGLTDLQGKKDRHSSHGCRALALRKPARILLRRSTKRRAIG